MFYRVRQFWHALRSQPLSESDLSLIGSVLTEQQRVLFSRLQASEQAHSLRVLQTLLNQGEDHPDLLVAALLHDVGKTRYPLRVWERVLIVLGKRFFPNRMRGWGKGQVRGWKRPFVIASEHACWGAELAQGAGASPLAVYLIREHQSRIPQERSSKLENRYLSLLQNADGQN